MIEDYYGGITDRVSNVPYEIKDFMSTPVESITYKMAKSARDAFLDVYDYVKGLQQEPDMVDDIFTVQGIFYSTYKPFVDKCNEILKDKRSISGYGGLKDYGKLKVVDLCRDVDYKFPYGWKRFGEQVNKYGIHESNTTGGLDKARITGERNYDGYHAFLVNSRLLDDMGYVNILRDILPDYHIESTGFSDEVAIFAPEDELDIVQDGIDAFNNECVK
jgi:hypothetical protein